MNTPPFDLYALHLFRRVAHFRSFTEAAKETGLSQSALSRQISTLETRLGVSVFERTTRSVRITEAGAILLRETAAIPNILDGALRRIQEDYLERPPEIRIAVASDLSLAHIPGIFGSHSRLNSNVRISVAQYNESDLIEKLCETQYDLGILSHPKKLPPLLQITHRMTDQFVIVSSGNTTPPQSKKFKNWISRQAWLLPPEKSSARNLITSSLGEITPTMELENFDLMLQFVSLEMGCAIVPRRTISPFPRKNLLTKINPPSEIARELIVVSPRHQKPTEHIQTFINGILFS